MKIEIERGLVEHAIEALEAGPHASILMNTGGIAQSLRTALRKELAAPQPAKCWKCSDADPLFQVACNVPACGMREALAAPQNQLDDINVADMANQQQEPVAWGNMSPGVRDGQRVLYTSKALAEAYDMGGYQSDPLAPLYTTPQPAPQQAPDALHLAAMDLARKQSDRIAELEAEVERFRQHALNEKAARQALEQQLAARVPLTEDELWSLWNSQGDDAMDKTAAIAFARATEAAHGITKGGK